MKTIAPMFYVRQVVATATTTPTAATKAETAVLVKQQ